MLAKRRRGSVARAAAVLACALALGAELAGAQTPPETKTPSSAEPAPAARRPRRRPRYKHLKPKPRRPRERITSPGWRVEVKQALEKLILEKGRASKKYDANWPPIAVVMLDNVVAAHHLGEVAFLRLVERAEFRFSDAWWERLPLDFRERAKRAHRRFTQKPEAVWPQDEDYLEWRKAMFGAYDLICKRDGRRACRAWLTQIIMGHTEGEAESYMRETLEEALSDPFRTDLIRAHAGDESPISASRGIRRIPAMAELVDQLLGEGFDVWALSSSNQWLAEAVSIRYGIDTSRVIGMRPRVINKRLQPDIIDPQPVGSGCSEAVIMFVGREPDLVVAGPEELELIEHGKGLRVVMDRSDDRFRARAVDRGWLLQPELPVGAPEAPEQ